MKKIKRSMLLLLVFCCVTVTRSHAQIPVIDAAKEVIKRVIKAIDLEIQRQQNSVIWLQDAQKQLENTMSELHLKEINDWVGKQKDLFSEYYNELQQVKSIIAYYQKVKDITDKQLQLINEYKRAWALLQSDKHFSASEISYMSSVFSGILDESAKDLDQLYMVVNSFKTQMSDEKRLAIINATADHMDMTYDDLRSFDQQAALLSLQRARGETEIEEVKKLYGL